MKKVLALVLAVMMLATVAFAAIDNTKIKWRSTIAPNGSIKVDNKNGITVGADTVTVASSSENTIGLKYVVQVGDDGKLVMDSGATGLGRALNPTVPFDGGIQDMLFRSVTTENYAVTNFRVATGRKLVKGVTINDKEERVEVKFVDDLNNTTAKDFDLTFTLKGKGKMILKDDELQRYKDFTGNNTKVAGDRVTVPTVKFSMSGKVGYGKVEIDLGTDTDEELESLVNMGVNKSTDVVKFNYGGTLGASTRIASAGTYIRPQAGAYTADAILTENYGEAFTLEARVYSGDVLFFDCDNDPDRDVIGRLADSDADMDFYIFNSDKNFTTFNSNAKLYFNDAEETDFVYQIKDDKSLVKVGSYSEDEGCWVVKTRTLGKYVVSDVELKEFEAAAGSESNPDTGANDVVGIATALAAVALVSAAAVSLKK